MGQSFADGAHLEVVGDDDATIACLAAQVFFHDEAREGGRHAGQGVETRIERMRSHDAIHAGLHGGEKRRQMAGVHLRPVRVDDGQPQVRVHRGMPLAGKCLAHADTPAACRPRIRAAP